jgi:hypothetical protein
MPVLLEPQDFDAWLDGSLGAEALKPAAEEKLREHLVSPRLNRTGVGDDDPTIIEPIGLEMVEFRWQAPYSGQPIIWRALRGQMRFGTSAFDGQLIRFIT